MCKSLLLLFLVSLLFIPISSARCGEIDDSLINAIIQVESGGRHTAVGKNGEIGLMQISPIVFKEWNDWRMKYWGTAYNGDYGVSREGKDALYEPNTNKIIGTWYLNRLKDHYLAYVPYVYRNGKIYLTGYPEAIEIKARINSREEYTLMLLLGAWNWGIGNVEKVNYDYNKFPRSVKNYIRKVIKEMR